jgi:hypothetical protein
MEVAAPSSAAAAPVADAGAIAEPVAPPADALPVLHGGCTSLADLQMYGDTVSEEASLSDGYQLRGADAAAVAVVSIHQGDACGSFVMPDGDGSAYL